MVNYNVSSNKEQARVWQNGRYVPAEKHADGNWYVRDDNGKLVKVDPNDLFGMNSRYEEIEQEKNAMWDRLDNSFEEQIESRQKWKEHWDAGLANAKEMAKVASESFVLANQKFQQILSNAGCEYEKLTGKKKDLADEQLVAIKTAKSQRNSASFDISFYARMSADESYSIGDIRNQQMLANAIQQSMG